MQKTSLFFIHFQDSENHNIILNIFVLILIEQCELYLLIEISPISKSLNIASKTVLF